MQKDFKPLVDLIIQAYEMPIWGDEKDLTVKQLKLEKLIGVLNSLKIEVPKIELSKLKLFDYGKVTKLAKDSLVEQLINIYPGVLPVLYLSEIHSYLLTTLKIDKKRVDNIVAAMTNDISIKIKDDQENSNHILLIGKQLGPMLNMKILSIEKNTSSGANIGFKVLFENGPCYYVKTFDEGLKSPLSASTNKIDARELLAYKVLEYLGFGPETHFLITDFSSSRGRTVKGNYIATKDVNNLDPKKMFINDNSEQNTIAFYKEAIGDKAFLIELFSMVSLNSILRLYDTFGDNLSNYGIIQTEIKDKNSFIYEPVLIDHLPDTSNATMNEAYSPGGFLQTALNPLLEKDTVKYSNLKEFINKDFSSRKYGLDKEVKSMVEKGKTGNGFKDSLDRAHQDISKLIERHPKTFADFTDFNKKVTSSQELLDMHFKVVFGTYETFMINYK
jgi:hypothetical protein